MVAKFKVRITDPHPDYLQYFHDEKLAALALWTIGTVLGPSGY